MDSRFTVALIIAGVLAGWGLWHAFRAFSIRLGRHGDRTIVNLRDTGGREAAHVDAARAVASAVQSDAAPLESSSRGADHRWSDQRADEADAPEGSASAQVEQWARGRECVSCAGPLIESRLAGHHIALLEPTGMTREWVDIAADRLPLALATCLPMCWNCHLAATFRRTHPHLVTDRDESIVHVKND